MLGLIGILGCLTIVAACVTAAAAIVSMGVSIGYAVENEERQEAADAKNKENLKCQQIMQRRQQAKALERAAQLAARGMLLDRIQTNQELREAKDARKRIHRQAPDVPRPSRNFGTPINENGVIRLK